MATACGLKSSIQPFPYYSAGHRPAGLCRQPSSVSTSSTDRRKTAAERLEETKGKYVKTGHVLGNKQEFRHRAPLQIASTNKFLKTIQRKASYELPRPVPLQLPSVPLRARTKSESSQVRKSAAVPRSYPPQTSDLEQRLKQLLTSSSKEDVTKEDPCDKDLGRYNSSDNIYKSMPDLSPIKNPEKSFRSSRNSYSYSSESFDEVDVEEEKEEDVGETALHCSLTTSDYVSRSSSYKSRYLCKLEKSFTQSHPPFLSGKLECQRPVSRSKSDVSYKYQKPQPEQLQKRNSYSSAELEHFFDRMGLDPRVWHTISAPSYPASPPCFFDSFSSINSDDHHSSVCSVDSDSPKDGLSNKDLKLHAPVETSIVEKNARVIKWLYNCKKAREAADS